MTLDPHPPSLPPPPGASGRRTRVWTVVLLYAAFAALWILLSDKAVEWLFHDPARITLVSTLKGWAFVAVTSLLLYGLMHRLLHPGAPASTPLASRRYRILSLGLLVAAILGLTGGGIAYSLHKHREQEVARLQAIADLKTRQIADWMRERYGDTRFVRTNRFWAELYRRWQDSGDEGNRALLLNRMEDFRRHSFLQAVLLLDAQTGIVWESTGGHIQMDPELPAAARRPPAANAGVLHFGPYRDETGGLHLDFYAPLPEVDGRPSPVVVLRADPAQILYPILQSWPVPSASGETLLFRRDGDQVLFLNELRHRPGTACRLRLPVESAGLLAAQVLRDGTRLGLLLEGVDYRGVPAMGVARSISGTDWFMVAKIDREELFAAAARDAVWICLAGLLALLMAATGAVLFRQHQELGASLRERALQAERLRALELLDAIAEGSSDAIFAKDRDGRYLLFNREAARVTGKPPREVLGRDDTAVFPPEQAALIMANDRQVMDQNRSVTFQEDLTTPEGDITFLATKGPLHDADGRVIGLFGISRDITQRRQAEEALSQSEARFRRAMDATSDGLWDWDVAHGEIYFSPGYFRMLGYEPGAIPADTETFLSLVHPEDRDRVLAAHESCIRDEAAAVNLEFRMRGQDGRWRWVLGRGRAVRRADTGQALQIVGTYVDITERKQAEAERDRVEGQLRQSQKMEALGTLAGGIAHDFNNILGIIIGYTELAAGDTEEQSPMRADLQEILRAAHRARDLVQQILAFSRLEAPAKKPLQLAPILKETVKMLRASLPATIEVHLEAAAKSVVLADPTQIHQVIMNLCANAGHAMREDGGRLDVRLTDAHLEPRDVASHNGLKPGPYVRLSVSDTGHGIPLEIRERIFDPFFTTKEQGVGTGLGLSVVHGIVKSHGGAIEVESAPGQGAAFTVLLPALERTIEAVKPAPDAHPRGSEHILVVDDEPALTRICRQALERLGYTVECCQSGPEALEAFRRRQEEKPFDMVITDMTMPRMTGLALARELLALRPDLPILISTGFSEKLNPVEAARLGIRGILMKPFEAGDLARVVRRVLDEDPGSEAVKRPRQVKS